MDRLRDQPVMGKSVFKRQIGRAVDARCEKIARRMGIGLIQSTHNAGQLAGLNQACNFHCGISIDLQFVHKDEMCF